MQEKADEMYSLFLRSSSRVCTNRADEMYSLNPTIDSNINLQSVGRRSLLVKMLPLRETVSRSNKKAREKWCVCTGLHL